MPVWIDYISDCDDYRDFCPTCGIEECEDHFCEACDDWADHSTAEHD
jgi:hypothetical protein